ncbi:RHS repeat-associated core domain-containing protein [Catenulispora sp. EB89]|uniref:RHS repeat domain-containing protein n=1 Tax=Catenulispora sp. EB89 TaxID=3156257 RepID=UPI00351667B3
MAVATGVVVGPAVASVTGHKSSSHQLWSPPQTQLSKTASVPGVNAAAVAKAPQTMTMAAPTVRPRAMSLMATGAAGPASAGTGSASGSTGNYTATDLRGSDAWSSGTGGGTFTYNYPVQLPSTLGGDVPKVALTYDSGTVDGETSAANAQASWIGDGWSYSPGFIERSYKPCNKDGITNSADNCWAGNNTLTIDAPGLSGTIVHDDATGAWHLANDSGAKVAQLTGAANGTSNGEYFTVTTTSGATYYFGLGHLPGGTHADPSTNSAFTQPVYSPNVGDPCYSASTGTGSFCTMGWRFNLDFVTDPHGNLQRFDYSPETNYYERGAGQNSGNGTLTQYVRGGTLSQISYGYRLSEAVAGAKPAAEVQFGTTERCTGSVSVCQTGNLQGTTGAAAFTNPGFESGSCTGWTCAGGAAVVNTQHNTGSDSLQLPAGGSAAQTVTGLSPSTTYTASAFAAGTGGCVTLAASAFDTSGTTASNCIGSAAGWSPGTVTFTTGPTSTSATITLSAAASNSAPMWVDDVSTRISPSYWPDVPADQNCNATGQCLNPSPTFWSTRMLSTITTQVLVGSSYQSVDSYALAHSFPATGDGTTPQLWLNSITRTATDGRAAITLPTVSFTGVQLANRVPGQTVGGQGLPALYHYRLQTITDELGAVTAVTYADSTPTIAACSQSNPNNLPKQDANGTLCFPQYWTPPNQSTPIQDWFTKYVVTQVTTTDDAAATPARSTAYSYTGAGAWHSNDNELADPTQRVWDQWRGFGQVTTTTGTAPDPLTQTVSTYLRGMNGDINAAGIAQTVSVTDSQGAAHSDDNVLAGFGLETQTYTAAGGAVVKDVISTPQILATTATHTRTSPLPKQYAQITGTAKTVTRDLLAAGTWRTHEVDYGFDTAANAGRLLTTDDKGDGTASSPEQCTSLSYAGSAVNPQLLDFVARKLTVTGPCGTTPTAANTVSDKVSLYDGNTAVGAANGLDNNGAAVGDATSELTLDHYDTATPPNPQYVTTSVSGYDAYGRVVSATDPNATDANHPGGAVTTTAYTPATGALPTRTVVTNPMGWTTTTTLDPGRDQPMETVDANGNTTDAAYDALGRVSGVWQPTHTKAANPTSPSEKFVYTVNGTASPSWTETETLRDDGQYMVSYEIVNGFGDVRQTQADAPDVSNGRDITDTYYDSHGWKVKTASAYFNASAPSSTILAVADNATPGQTVTTYDGLGRPTVSTFYSYANAQWHSTTAYPGADETDVTPPTGTAPSSTITDVRGHTTASWRYRTATATGHASDADVTSYAYDFAGRPSSLTDPTGKNTWTYSYDVRGRKTSSTDPDTGLTTIGYTADSQVATTTDARGQALSYTYDLLGRQTSEYSGTSTTDSTKLLTSTLYDTQAKGLQTSATRYTAGSTGPAYVTAVSGYTPDYKPTGTTVTIPSVEGSLAGAYTTTETYTPNLRLVSHTGMPGIGDLSSETLAYGYNFDGLLETVGGNNDYLAGTTYNGLGQVLRSTYGDMPNQAVQTIGYDTATGRVLSDTVDKETGTTTSVDVTNYTYNAAGQITSAQDKQDSSNTDLQCYGYDYAGHLTTAWSDTGATTTAASPTVPGIGGCANAAPTAATASKQVGGPAPYWQTYSFDIAGNRTGETDHNTAGTTAGDVTHTYNYPAAGANQPNTSTSTTISGGTTGTDTFVYDAAGNTTTRKLATGANQTLTWDAEGRLASVADAASGKSASYIYDASGGLLLQKQAGETILYLDGQELHLNTAGNSLTGLRDIPGSGGVTVVLSGSTFAYDFANLQGTGTVSIDALTLTTTRRYYDPYGNTRGTPATSWPDERAYLNKPADTTTGLDLIGARNYDPAAGRFISVDPLFEAGDPNQMGGYVYSGGDPVNTSDPTGLCKLSDGDLCLDTTGTAKDKAAAANGGSHDVNKSDNDYMVDAINAAENDARSPSQMNHYIRQTSTSDGVQQIVNRYVYDVTVTHYAQAQWMADHEKKKRSQGGASGFLHGVTHIASAAAHGVGSAWHNTLGEHWRGALQVGGFAACAVATAGYCLAAGAFVAVATYGFSGVGGAGWTGDNLHGLLVNGLWSVAGFGAGKALGEMLPESGAFDGLGRIAADGTMVMGSGISDLGRAAGQLTVRLAQGATTFVNTKIFEYSSNILNGIYTCSDPKSQPGYCG